MIHAEDGAAPGAEPIFDVAELSALELYSPRASETVWFFKTLLGMVETGRCGESVFLRGWQDAYRHSLKITQRDRPGMGYAAWRATSPAALQRRVRAIEATGLGRRWVAGEGGVGPAYEFALPDGSVQRIHWEARYFEPDAEAVSILLNRPQRRPLHGIPVRGLDHINLFARDVTRNRRFLMDALGFKVSEYVVTPDNAEAGAWLRLMTKSHDLALVKDQAGDGGRLHHVAFVYGNSQHLADICDVMTDAGLEIEAGPALHAISQAQFVYVLEPGGNRIELVGEIGYTITDPSWQPVLWAQDALDHAVIFYGGKLPPEFDTYGTPHQGPTTYRTPNRYVQAEVGLILA
jgi:catechol 2,3-dioxygenase